MNGEVIRICLNQSGNPTFGFIYGDDGQDYFFHKNSLIRTPISSIRVGDRVEFTPVPGERPGQMAAVSVRKLIAQRPAAPQYATKGIHRDVDMETFREDERKIIETLSEALFVTNGGKDITVGNSQYRYSLVKPTENYVHLFNLQREIPVVFSSYEFFEPRCLDVAAEIAKSIATPLRLDRSCQIIVSRDGHVEERLAELLRDSNLSSVVIPFTYDELMSKDMTPDRILDRFRKYLFDADLFTTSQPIVNDVFFFGRREYALDVATKCRNASYLCGVFGLRRSGKTSMLYAIKRQLESAGCPVAFIPCQTELETLDWKQALYQVTERIIDALNVNIEQIRLHPAADYQANNANVIFVEDMTRMLHDQPATVVLMFDEIEAITFGVGKETGTWYDGDSFIHFWDVLRGFCIRSDSNLSIVVAGTNPMINEVPTVGENGTPNPMFQQLSVANQGGYLQPFDFASTKTMINTLGGYMGITFEDSIPGKLVEDCGGHPYLIRMLCGYIYKYVRENQLRRPTFTVSRAVYETARSEFEKSSDAESFYMMILEILQRAYPREYDTLKILATNGDEQLYRVLENPQIKHLIGYGLVERNGERFAIRYDTVKRFLQGKYAFERTGLNFRQQALEINTRMNDGELRLRALVRRTLSAHRDTINPKEAILDAMRKHKDINEDQVNFASGLSYKELFDTTVNRACFFLVLVFAIEQNYDNAFSAIFDEDKDTVIKKLKGRFNRYRQIPAHPIDESAKNWSDEEFYQFREDMLWLEKVLDDNE